jgi:hypothetical protein
MHIPAVLILPALAVAAIAQSGTLALATGGTNQGNPNGGIYFDVTFNTVVTLDSINYFASPASAAGNSSFEIYVGPSTWVGNVAVNPGVWTLVGTSTPVMQPGGVLTPITGVINPAGPNPGTVTFEPGTYGIALKAVGHSWRYSNAATLTTFSDPFVSAKLGGASNAFLTLPTFSPRVMDGALNYTIGGTPMPFAQRAPYGPGCYAKYQSFYELFPNTAVGFDMSMKSMYMTFDPSGNRYSSVVGGTVAVVPPASPNLVHGDNANIIINLEPIASPQPILFPTASGIGIATSTVEMCSNLYVNLQGSTAALANPTVTAWLTGLAVRLGNHHDVNPTAGGSTHYEYDVGLGQHRFTWLNVPDFNIAATSNTFQIVFFANSDVEFRWGAMSLSGGGGWPTLIGFTTGNGALDPGNIDLSAAIAATPPLATENVDRHPLTLVADVNPIIGATVNLTTSQQTGLSVGLLFIGIADLGPLSPAGLDLGFLGAPGCVVNVNTSPSISPLIDNLGGSMTVPFAIPPNPVFYGTQLFSQAIWLDPLAQNQFFGPGLGLLSSNAVKLKIGGF